MSINRINIGNNNQGASPLGVPNTDSSRQGSPDSAQNLSQAQSNKEITNRSYQMAERAVKESLNRTIALTNQSTTSFANADRLRAEAEGLKSASVGRSPKDAKMLLDLAKQKIEEAKKEEKKAQDFLLQAEESRRDTDRKMQMFQNVQESLNLSVETLNSYKVQMNTVNKQVNALKGNSGVQSNNNPAVQEIDVNSEEFNQRIVDWKAQTLDIALRVN